MWISSLEFKVQLQPFAVNDILKRKWPCRLQDREHEKRLKYIQYRFSQVCFFITPVNVCFQKWDFFIEWFDYVIQTVKYRGLLYLLAMSHTRFRVNPHSLNVKELLAQSRCEIWSLSDCNCTRTHSDLVHKQTLNHLAKYLTI